MPHTVIICNNTDRREQAVTMARRLGVEILFDVSPGEITAPDFALVYQPDALELAHTGRKAPGPIRCDFSSGAVNHRRQFGGGKNQMIARACGIGSQVKPHILDATAGLGRDAFVLATLGCRVQLVERNPVVYELLNDGLIRAQNHPDTSLVAIISRMELAEADARVFMQGTDQFDVVYLDPMFPERQKTAQVKKEMRAFHSLVGGDQDADELLQSALDLARFRVVVKRPRKAPYLAGRSPGYSLEGKSCRFDIYALRKLPDVLNDESHAKNDTVG